MFLAAFAHGAKPAPVGASVDFARDIAPILAAHCVRCHGVEKQEAGLRLDRRNDALRGGDSGAVIVPAHSGESSLLHRVTSQVADERMPPAEAGRALSRDEVWRLRRWIDAGAAWPVDGSGESSILTKHWAYQPVVRPTPPQVEHASWGSTPIDAFIVDRLTREGLAPSPEAEASTLVRRLHLDLTGLLPVAEEAAEFVRRYSRTGHEREDAYAALVDKLLSSPHFGERWGRHWLDLARYGDSNGYELDIVRPNAWRYRDWVLAAINDDLPFDRFIVEQIAGDLLPAASLDQRTATGFHRMTIKNTESGINEEDYRNREMVDRVNTTASAVLGVSLGCAQCHTHKYNPFTIDDYYRFYAFFNNVEEVEIELEGTAEERKAYDIAVPAHFEKWLTLQAQQRLLDELVKHGAEQSGKAIEAATAKADAQLESQRSLAKLGLDAWLKETLPDVQKSLAAPPTIANFLKADAKKNKKFEKEVERYLSSLPIISEKLDCALRCEHGYAAYLGNSIDLTVALAAKVETRSKEQTRLVADFIASLPARQDDVKQNLRLLVTEERYLPSPNILALKENNASPRPTHVLLRGDFKQHGDDKVEPGTPTVLPEPVLNVLNPPGIDAGHQRRTLEAVSKLNAQRLATVRDPEIASRISQYELAFRMQSSAPELTDLAGESAQTLAEYGVDRESPRPTAEMQSGDTYARFAKNCLLARRMVERGVRFVSLIHASWDQHSALKHDLAWNCGAVDQPIGALLRDLKRRGLLDETLVVWGTEFGRTPLGQGKDGRDHHPFAFSMWMAGGGTKPGYVHGETDEIGWAPTRDAVHVNDFQATLLHLFGLDHKRLTVDHKGLPTRLTNLGGTVIQELLA